MRRFKLVSKRNRWGLTNFGRLLLFIFLLLLIVGYVRDIVDFLSPEETINAKIMVIEGYVPDYAYGEIIKTFDKDSYDLIVTSGTSYDQGFYISGVSSSAELIRNSLLVLGFDSTKIVAVPIAPSVFKDRTYHSALFSYNYIIENYPETQSVNIVSVGPHAARSKYLFALVYEPEIEIGNIVIPHISVNADNWYKSSRGFRMVLNESISYFYVIFFFWPDRDSKDETK